jgi:ABC-type Mn2+/Zn2+ transport system permease subunit
VIQISRRIGPPLASGLVIAILSAMVLAAVCCLSLACALLSVIVVARRWAFIGEGIAHSGFGGAGTAWMLFLAFPSLASGWVFQIAVVLFCLVTAAAITGLSRSQRTSADAAIGIFMVASLAWGFLAEQIYMGVKRSTPFGFDEMLFGKLKSVSGAYLEVTIFVSIAVIVTLVLFSKEILYYCLDPVLAEVSGVPARFVHYLLMLLLALIIVLGIRIIGSVLFTALLVFPAATANLLSKRLWPVVGISIATALAGAVVGLGLNWRWPVLPEGPCIVLTLFVVFLAAFAGTRRGMKSEE